MQLVSIKFTRCILYQKDIELWYSVQKAMRLTVAEKNTPSFLDAAGFQTSESSVSNICLNKFQRT